MKRVRLPNRYGDNNYLEEVSPDRYKLVTDDEYCRFGINKDGSYNFVDPSGGPFMAVGNDIVHLGTIKEIDIVKDEGTFITFQNDISSNSKQGTVQE